MSDLLNVFLLSSLEAVLLVAAVSADAFVASFAYGSNKIKIPLPSILVISVISSAVLALSLFLGTAASAIVPAGLTRAFCFLILFCIGIVKLFDSTLKKWIKKHSLLNKEIHFSIFHLSFILNVYADPPRADQDLSQTLSPAEAAPLAIALSMDGLAAGFGAGLASISIPAAAALSLLVNIGAVLLGCRIGNRIAEKLPLDFSWLSGLLLIVLAFLKL